MHRLSALALTQVGHPHHPLRLRDGLPRNPGRLGPLVSLRPKTSGTPSSSPGPASLTSVSAPYDYLNQAASITTSLRLQRRSTQHVPGTTVTVHPYVPGLDYADPHVPKDPDQLATLIDGDPGGDGMGRHFPDLWARLHAQEGYECAGRIWSRACNAVDALHHAAAEVG
ncbi:hypothetical protein ACFWA5_48740 [Streptomyces mirabilis]|uniref:hypothetical protein n=1 Tax=Streptomyces mirabilis TaxID=68239 RepID=UPI00366779D1